MAASLGLEYEGEAREDLLEAFSGFRLFSLESANAIRHRLYGRIAETDVSVFTHAHWQGPTKHEVAIIRHQRSPEICQTVAAFPVDSIPPFRMFPESIVHKLGSLLGMQDIDFDESSRFSRRYLLQGEDVNGIRSLFQRGALQHFEKQRGWCVESDRKILIVYRSGEVVPPESIPDFLETARQILSLFTSGDPC